MFTYLAPARTLAVGFAAACIAVSASGATLFADAQLFRFNCAANGDPFCAGGQVLGDPALAPVHVTIPSATNASIANASNSFVDPRIGTDNGADAVAFARLGVLRTASTASVSSSPVLGTSTPNLMRLGGMATASFTDSLTILPSSTALLGLPGTFTGSVMVRGALSPSGVNFGGSSFTVASADWRMEFHVGSSMFGNVLVPVPGFFGGVGVDANGNLSTFGLGPIGLVTFTAPVFFGTPFSLQASFAANASAVIDGALVKPLNQGVQVAHAEAQYVNSATWNGIQAVRSAGQDVLDYSVVSDSGLNYASAITAVPEPDSALLLGAGLIVLAARYRASKRCAVAAS